MRNALKASTSPNPFYGEAWFDPLEEAVRFQVRAFIEAMVEAEYQAAFSGRMQPERRRGRPLRSGYLHRIRRVPLANDAIAPSMALGAGSTTERFVLPEGFLPR